MSIPSSGPVSFTTIQTEFGGSNPIGMNEYYAGGAYVPSGTSGTYGAVPSSGAISVRNFYGTSAATVPTAPTIGTATAVGPGTVEVTYTASSSNGGSTITYYTAVASPGGNVGYFYGSTSGTITVSGLSNGTAYTFTVYATNAIGNSPSSSASNSITPSLSGSRLYLCGGAYTWVVPSCVTSISVLTVGAGAYGGSVTGPTYCCCSGYWAVATGSGGGGGGLAFRNNISVTPGTSYCLYVNLNPSGRTYFNTSCYLYANGGNAGSAGSFVGGTGGSAGGTSYCGRGIGGDGGGGCCNRGLTYPVFYGSGGGGGGAAGYSGVGGTGGYWGGYGGPAGSLSGGGGGGAGGGNGLSYGGGGGGGVGLYGPQGTTGAGGATAHAGGGGGANGATGGTGANQGLAGVGGNYGGGSGGAGYNGYICGYGRPALRIVWPGNTRQFPSTNVCSP